MQGYEFLEQLGEGAYGAVWKCRDRDTGRIVAIKGFKEAHKDAVVMHLATREAKLLQSIAHPNVVTLLKAFRSQSNHTYLVFEYMRTTVHALLDRQPLGLPPPITKTIAWQLLRAMTYLHERKLIHRDV
ncbi:hypothetical protein HYH02_005944 [Chlamydomonas schloesseri]|uniref:cyclin-dependent kinase n=1 Tax=Chlamydomonas schloesseri TaxID=2026947 RepID=A0A836B6N2_9CHLO|nr:hypothetical protein HYH02_005944 [Chlamydomonas schloesseri]|eukprot:KAG2449197.1 hypothetical protein HYH02_005944 [Chlamydomonas schloesseri]